MSAHALALDLDLDLNRILETPLRARGTHGAIGTGIQDQIDRALADPDLDQSQGAGSPKSPSTRRARAGLVLSGEHKSKRFRKI